MFKTFCVRFDGTEAIYLAYMGIGWLAQHPPFQEEIASKIQAWKAPHERN